MIHVWIILSNGRCFPALMKASFVRRVLSGDRNALFEQISFIVADEYINVAKQSEDVGIANIFARTT